MHKADIPKVAEVTWEDPDIRTRYDWPKIAAQLRSRPMEWAKIFEGGKVSAVNAVRQGSVSVVHPDLGFEVLTTNNKRTQPRICDMFMRFNPDKENGLRAAVTSTKKGRKS